MQFLVYSKRKPESWERFESLFYGNVNWNVVTNSLRVRTDLERKERKVQIQK